MKLRIVVVGTLKRTAERELCDDYVRRLRRYCTVEEIELKPGRRLEAQIAKATAGTNVVALDVTGDRFSSEKLAGRLERLASRGKGVVALVIGGADGLPRAVIQSAAERWSLSDLTLPHRLARVVLCEQLYRAMTILRNEPYSH